MDTAKVMPDGSNSSANGAKRTDMPVLLPVATQSRQAAMIERREGTYRLNMQPRHVVWVAGLLVVACTAAQAATPAGLIGPVEALFKWMGFILWGPEGGLTGFSLNLIISFFAMVIGTVACAV